jgi:hypothetical protein
VMVTFLAAAAAAAASKQASMTHHMPTARETAPRKDTVPGGVTVMQYLQQVALCDSCRVQHGCRVQHSYRVQHSCSCCSARMGGYGVQLV